MKLSTFFWVADIICIAIAFFFPDEIYGLGLVTVNLLALAVYALSYYFAYEDKRRHLDEIDLVF